VRFIWQSSPKVGESWIIYDTDRLPRKKNVAVSLKIFGKRRFLNLIHQGGDTFTAFPITFWSYLKLKIYRLFR
jgi:hypothetical protein